MKANHFVVYSPDGQMFRCFVQPVGARLQNRWVFADTTGKHHIGPPFKRQLSESQVQTMLDAWLTERDNPPGAAPSR